MRRAFPTHAVLLALALCMPSAPRASVGADPNFNGGLHFVDRFSGSGAGNFVGEKIVRRTNGEVIVAGHIS